MDIKLVNPFLDAITSVLPSLGFQNISKGKLSVGEDFVESKGVTIVIGLTHQIQGNIAYNMSVETAKKFASIMMMGMPVNDLDSLAQSAITELVNMVTGNAATKFANSDLKVDISPPSLATGEEFKVKLSKGKFIILELLVDEEVLELNMGVTLN